MPTESKSSAIVATCYAGVPSDATSFDAVELPEMPQPLPGVYCFTCDTEADTNCLLHHDTDNVTSK